MRTEYVTTVNEEIVFTGDNLESAIRAWDFDTHDMPNATGGISVQVFEWGVMVRDGWILHVDNGRIYLNPNLSDGKGK